MIARRWRRGLVLAFAAVLAAGACGGDGGSATLAGYVRDPAPTVGDVSLPEVTNGGAPLPFRAVDDHLLLVYFGYTSCPDVCPTTLADVRGALDDLDEGEAAVVDLALVTVDPERDVDEVVSGYVQSFVPDAHALRTTDDAELRTAADAFGVEYSVDTNDEGEVEVVHSGSLYAVDDEGRLVLTWPFGTPRDDLANDLSLLIEGRA